LRLRDYKYIDTYLDLLAADIDERMLQQSYKMIPEHLELALDAYRWLEGFKLDYTRVLDVGCVDGTLVKYFNQSAKQATGLTVNPQEVALCRASGLEVIQADMNFMPVEEKCFDLIWCRDTLEHTVMPLLTLFEFNRILKPGGYLVAIVPKPGFWTSAANHYSVLTDENWRWLMQRAGFQLIQFDKKREIGGEYRYLCQKKAHILNSGEAKSVKIHNVIPFEERTFTKKFYQENYLIKLYRYLRHYCRNILIGKSPER
jgi:SAM-dependent methyltransferase